MKTIKIKFTGFWPEFNENDNFIINVLKRKYEVVLSDNPDYVISSCFSNEYLDYDCIRIFYTGENLCPDFNVFDYAMGFEYLTFGDRYIRFPNYLIADTYQSDYELMIHKHEQIDSDFLKNKESFCAFVVSKGNGYVDSIRELIFKKLSEYKKVNSGGKFLNNIGKPNGVEDKLKFQCKHKFVIACENSAHEGYTTEKIVQAYAARAIPIYWGNRRVNEVFNPKSFINVNDFSSLDDLVKYIEEIDHDDEKYLTMLKEPALINTVSLQEEYDKLELFLDHIFSQEIQDAYRRDLVGYGAMHCDRLRKMKRLNRNVLIRKILSFF